MKLLSIFIFSNNLFKKQNIVPFKKCGNLSLYLIICFAYLYHIKQYSLISTMIIVSNKLFGHICYLYNARALCHIIHYII